MPSVFLKRRTGGILSLWDNKKMCQKNNSDTSFFDQPPVIDIAIIPTPRYERVEQISRRSVVEAFFNT